MYFMGFLIVIRLDMILSALIILFIFIIYFIELNKDFYLDHSTHDADDKKMDNNNKYWITFNTPYNIRLFKVNQTDFKIINKIEILLYYVIVILLVAGFIEYVGKIRDTLSKTNKLTWVDIMLDTNISKLQYNKSFWSYFKIGLGIK
jgi:cell division protein FtsL